RIDTAQIVWKEDIRRWHPGQEWILGPGGFGVFDPGINALSIVTEILPEALLLESAQMDVPAGRASPLAATLAMRSGSARVTAEFDFLQTGPQSWDIAIDTDAGTLRLAMGGSILQLPGEAPQEAPDREYPRLYARFADLVASGASDVDIRPLKLVADAFLLAERRTTAAFAF
ncbi:MAG: gfo/Idh/MocA family oxidoreductase, partial [Sphingomonadales bacterium]